jgi:hypothetical protein
VKPTLAYRLFKIGRMPEEVRAGLVGAVFFQEGVPMTVRRRFRAPGRIRHGIRLGSCALAITGDRIVIAFRDTVVDGRLAASGTGRLEVSQERIDVRVDVSSIDPRATGHIRVTCKWPLPPEILADLPRTSALEITASARLLMVS